MEEIKQDAQGQYVLYGKLARVMGQLSRLPKRGHNPHFGYDYVQDSDVTDAVREALAAEKVALLVNLINVERRENHTQVTIDFTFACGDTGITHTCRWQGEALDKQDKGLSKAYTAAKKYFLLTTLLISTGMEPDTDGEGEKGAEGKTERPRAAPAPGGKSDNGDLGSIPPAMQQALTGKDISHKTAANALGAPLVMWLRQNPGKSWQDALGEILAVTGKDKEE